MSESSHPVDFSDASGPSRFLLSFIQALLKTGYYTPGHPETDRAREGLYNDFASVVRGHHELTFVTTTAQDMRYIFIDGITDEPESISGYMLKGMAEMFIPKFLAYFDRKNLLSFSIKACISREEFENFLDIMSESPQEQDAAAPTKEKLTLDLINKSVLNISTVFNVDLVGKERKLPWRVEMSLTRLKRDLSVIPLYRNLSEDKIADIKHMVFDDIIRPIRSHVIVKEILINLDIISTDIAGISRDEFVKRVTSYVNKEYLLGAAPEILEFLIFLQDSHEKIQDENLLERISFTKKIARNVALKLIDYGVAAEDVLLAYCDRGILETTELPDTLQNRIRTREEAEKFIKDPDAYYAGLSKSKSSDEKMNTARQLLLFVPELIMRRLYDITEDVLIRVNSSGYDLSDIDEGLSGDIVLSVGKTIRESPKDEQMRILEITDLMGELALVILTDYLTHPSRLVRKISCDKLIHHGKASLPVLMESLDTRPDPHFVRNVIMILAEICRDTPELEEVFTTHLRHNDSRIRAESITGLATLCGEKAEDLLLHSLQDESPLVRKRAVWALAKIHSSSAKLLSYYTESLTGKVVEDESVIEQILSHIRTYQVDSFEAREFEKTIVDALSKGSGMLGKLSAKHAISSSLRAAMCDTLASIGSEKSLDILKKISKKDDPSVRSRAAAALKAIMGK